MTKGKCVLISAGEFVPIEIDVDKENGDFLIAVDGGYKYCKMLGINPDLIVGDFDSAGEKDKEEIGRKAEEKVEMVKYLPKEKDDTDTLFALKEGLERGFSKFHIYGAMGGRLDHTIANIQSLVYLTNQNARGYLIDDKSIVTVIRNETIHFRKETQGIISIFSIGNEAKGVTLKGLKYPLNDAVVSNSFPIGVSNEFGQEESSITVNDGTLLVILNW